VLHEHVRRPGGADPLDVRRAAARTSVRSSDSDSLTVMPNPVTRPAMVPASCAVVGVDWAIRLCSTTTSSGTRHSAAMFSAS